MGVIVTRNQPQGLVRLDRSNPATSGLENLVGYFGSGALLNAADGSFPSVVPGFGTPLRPVVSQAGVGMFVSANSQPGGSIGNTSQSSGGGQSAIAVVYINGTSISGVNSALVSSNGGSGSFNSGSASAALYWSNSSGVNTLGAYFAWTSQSVSISGVPPGLHTIGYTHGAGLVPKLFLDGLLVATGTLESSYFYGGGLALYSFETNTFTSLGAGSILLKGNYTTALADLTMSQVTANPWQLFASDDEPLWKVAAGGTNTAINPAVGSVAFTGYVPTIARTANQSVAPSVGSIAFTGFAPTISQPQSATAGAGALAITGYAPTVTQNASTNIVPGAGSLALTGYAPSIAQSANQSVSPAVGSVTFTGFAPTLTQTANQAVIAGTGSIAFTGYTPTVTQAQASPNLLVGVGSLTITGYAPNIRQGSPALDGAPDYGSKKKQYLVKRGEQLYVYRSKAQALAAIRDEEAAEAQEVSERSKKVAQKAAKRAQSAINLPDVEQYAKDAGRIDQYQQAYTSQHLDALLAMFNDMRDEEDIEILLLAA